MTGSRTLLTWDKKNDINLDENLKNENNLNEDIKKDTKLSYLLNKYPKLKEELIKYNSIFKVLNSPLSRIMIPKATIEKMSERSGIKIEKLIHDLKEIIKNISEVK